MNIVLSKTVYLLTFYSDDSDTSPKSKRGRFENESDRNEGRDRYGNRYSDR